MKYIVINPDGKAVPGFFDTYDSAKLHKLNMEHFSKLTYTVRPALVNAERIDAPSNRPRWFVDTTKGTIK